MNELISFYDKILISMKPDLSTSLSKHSFILCYVTYHQKNVSLFGAVPRDWQLKAMCYVPRKMSIYSIYHFSFGFRGELFEVCSSKTRY